MFCKDIILTKDYMESLNRGGLTYRGGGGEGGLMQCKWNIFFFNIHVSRQVGLIGDAFTLFCYAVF